MGADRRSRRRIARRWIGVLDRTQGPARNPQFIAAEQISTPDGAERSLFSSLGRAGGVLCALRAADSCLRADHGGRRPPVPPRVFSPPQPRPPVLGAGGRFVGGGGEF